MKAFLSLAITAWLGWAGGAVTDEQIPGFWTIWVILGLCLFIGTVSYVYERREV